MGVRNRRNTKKLKQKKLEKETSFRFEEKEFPVIETLSNLYIRLAFTSYFHTLCRTCKNKLKNPENLGHSLGSQRSPSSLHSSFLFRTHTSIQTRTHPCIHDRMQINAMNSWKPNYIYIREREREKEKKTISTSTVPSIIDILYQVLLQTKFEERETFKIFLKKYNKSFEQ